MSNNKKQSAKNLIEKHSSKILTKIHIIEEEESSKNELSKLSSNLIESYQSPNKKGSYSKKKLSSKIFFTPKNPKRVFHKFHKDKIHHMKISRKLSHTNTRIFSALIRNSIIKRQNEQERFQVIIKCLLNNINNRSKEDINMIKSFLKDNKIAKELIFDKFNKENENLLKALSYEMEYKNFPKSEKICEISEKIDNIYLIIKGKVEIYELVEYKVDMTLYKYIKWIYNLNNTIETNDYKYNLEIYKLKKDIQENGDIINISFEDIPYLVAISIKYKLAYMIRNNKYNIFSEDLEQIINDCKADPLINLQNFEYDTNKRNNYYYIKHLINELYTKLPIIQKELMDKYFILNNNEEHYYSFKRYNLKKVRELRDGDYLGENTMDQNGLRNCSVITLEETHLGSIDYDLYSDIINTYKEKIRDREAKFLKDSFYFKKISLQYFIKNYFSEFTYQELIHGNNILIQNQTVEYLYFLKEGIIEIFCNKSIVELIDLIKLLSQKLKNSDSEEIKSDLLNIKSKLYLYGKLNKNYTLKITSRLLIIANTDILGVEAWSAGFPFFYNCKIISDKAKFYKIPVNKIDILFDGIKEGKEQFLIDSNKRLNILCKRLLKIVKTRVDYNNTFYFDKEKEIFCSQKKLNNIFGKNKKLFISDNIKELLDIKNIKNKEKESNKDTLSTFFHLTFSNINKENNILFNMNDAINKNYYNNAEENKFSKTQYIKRKKNGFSYRNLLLKKEKERAQIKSNKNLIPKLNSKQNVIFTNSEKNFLSNDLFKDIILSEENKNIINKKIYSIKGELRLLKNLKNVLEEELLLSKRKVTDKKTSKWNNTDKENNVKKSKTLIIKKNELDEEFKNEPIKSRSHSRKISMNMDLDHFFKNRNITNSATNTQFSTKDKNNNNNINSFIDNKNKLCLGDKSLQMNNYTQKSLKIFFDNKGGFKQFQNYKYRLTPNKYCLTERDMYKKKIYKIIYKKIKEPNYFYNTFK